MKKIWIIGGVISAFVLINACGGGSTTTPQTDNQTTTTESSTPPPDNSTTAPGTSDDPKGMGKYTEVALTNPLDEKMLAKGQETFDVKCASCHKLTDEKLVGPGWKDVTKRRKPEWIMNFATNTDEMLDKDATAMSLLEICLVRMPNQNLNDEEARGILEFMRKNDGEK